MSTALLLHDGPTPTRLDASQWTEALPGAPFGIPPGMVYHSMYPLPGSTCPPLASPPDATLSAFSSSAPSAGGANYFPNYQGYNTIYPPAGFIPPIENPPMNANNFQIPRYSFYDMPVGTATNTSTTAVLPSEDTGHLGQPFQFTFQCPFPTQPEAAPFQDQRQGQYHVQVAQEDLAVGEPPREPGEGHSEDYETRQESHAAPVEPEDTTTDHICVNNPTTVCTGRGTFCLDSLCPGALSPEQVSEYIIAAIAPSESNAGQSADLFSQVDTNLDEPLPSQHGHASWETGSSGSSTTVPTPTSEISSSSGSSFPYSPNRLETTPSSTDTVGSLTGKQKRSKDHPEDRPKKHRREDCTDTQEGDHEEHQEPCNNHRILDDGEGRRKKKRRSIDGEYFCIICEILGTPCHPLSRKDSLKRHILQLHKIFQILFKVDYKDFKVLEPRRINEFEDLSPLIAFCITLQSEARARGVEIKEEEDLRRRYPQIASAVDHS